MEIELFDTKVPIIEGWEYESFDNGSKKKKPVLRPAELCVEEYANVTLNCTTSGRSRIAINWFKDGKAVPAKAALSEWNRALTVPDISRDNEGTYTCEARNQVYSAMSNPSKIAVTHE
ncbi:UNVERIFIED_CONTAM: hypothetical protein K2H54_060620 [Gekko kuhli]